MGGRAFIPSFQIKAYSTLRHIYTQSLQDVELECLCTPQRKLVLILIRCIADDFGLSPFPIPVSISDMFPYGVLFEPPVLLFREYSS